MKHVLCDWGTTNLRAYLTEDGRVLQTYAASTGLRESREMGFANVMQKVLDDFQVSREIPISLSGMVGSKNGWKEAPYTSTPANAQAILRQSVTSIEGFPNLRILGGVSHQREDGRRDVMRGEEVQVIGVLQKHPDAKTICLPGSHSKWVDVEAQVIRNFSTWMTGEFFHCFSRHSIFQEQITSDAFDESAFLQGVSTANSTGHLLNSLFHLRTDYLFGKIGSDQFHSYLSGFLIGEEITATAKGQSEVYLCGADAMMDYYARALGFLNIPSVQVSGQDATVLGLQSFAGDA